MAEKSPLDQFLLARFLNNQCTEEEKQAVLDWLADPENKHAAQLSMKHHWDEVQRSKPDPGVDVEKLLAKTQQKVFSAQTPPAVVEEMIPPAKPVRESRFSWRMAAVWIGILMTFSAALFFYKHHRNNTGFLTGNNETQQLPGGTEEVKSTSGQITLKTLSDGTRVWLNAQSSLIFPASFSGREKREVVLKGEAFFDVAEDKAHPFIVRTQNVSIVVLGTAFNLKSYDGDPTIETTLVRGKVVMENDHAGSVVMKPNQKVVFSHATESFTLVDVQLKQPTTWNNGSLEFEDTQVYDVIRSLERWYGVTIHLQDDPDMNCRLTARIDRESLGETMEVLKSLTGIRYSIVERDVFIEGRICGSENETPKDETIK